MVSYYPDVSSYITRDGSTIRELIHPNQHGAGNQSLAEARVAPGCSTLLHRHEKSEEIYHITAGHARMILESGEYLLAPEDAWLYGNLSPLVNIEDVEQNKKLYISYAIKTNRIFGEIGNSIPRKIAEFYKIKIDNTGNVDKIEKKIKDRLNELVNNKNGLQQNC